MGLWLRRVPGMRAAGEGLAGICGKDVVERVRHVAGSDMRQLSDKDAESLGIVTRHEQMDNGEYRFRLLASDGSAYSRTVAGDRGAWQNSHSHNTARETYIVQSGWMAFAQRGESEV